MTITTNPTRDEYTSSAGQTVFNYTFKIFENTDLNVYVTPAGQDCDDTTDITTDYVVDPATIGNEAGGFITFNTPLNAGDLVTIVSDIPASRTTDYQNNGDFRPDTVNDDFDRVVSLVKQVEDLSNRSLLSAECRQGPKPLILSEPEAGRYLRWRGDQLGLENVDLTDITDIVALSDLIFEFDTVAAMKASSISFLLPGQRVSTKGYYTSGDGGGGIYLIKSHQSVDGFGDHALANGNVALLQVVGIVNIQQYGAVGDGVADDTASIQAAVDSFPANGGELFVPAGIYKSTTEINVKTPVLFLCEGRFDVSTNANTSGTLLVTFRWGGAADEYMFVFSTQTSAELIAGTTTGEIINGGGIDGALLDGQNTAGFGVWAASTTNAKFNIQSREFKNTGILVDGGNAALSVRNEFIFRIVWGTQTDSRPMNGIHFRRYNGQPSTQNRILSASGLIYDGDLIINQDTDNNVFNHVHGVTQSGGTGRAMSFRNGITNHGRNNFIEYINGDIYAESSTYGNRIMHHNSEGSSIQLAAGAQIHYDAVDYVNAEVWGTHRFKMRDEYHVTPDAMRPDGTVCTSVVVVGNLWSALNFPESASGYATFSIPKIYDWNNGAIESIEFLFTTDGTSAGNAVFKIRALTPSQLSGLATPSVNENATLSVNGAINVANKRTHTLSTPIEYSNDDALLMRIDRLPADAADTHTNNIKLLGLILNFVAVGPDSGGSGPYDVGPDGI